MVDVAKQEQQDQEKIIEQVRPLDNQIAMLKDKQVASSKTVNTLNQQKVEKSQLQVSLNQTVESIKQQEKIAAQYLVANQADSLLEKYLGQWQIKVTQVRDLERQHKELLNSVQASERTLATQQAALQAAKDSKLAQDKALTELVSAENQAKQQWDALQQQANEHTLNVQKEVLEHWSRNTNTLVDINRGFVQATQRITSKSVELQTNTQLSERLTKEREVLVERYQNNKTSLSV